MTHSAVIVLHSSRAVERTYVVNVAQMSYWANNQYPAGSTVWLTGNESPILVTETPDEITDLFLGGGTQTRYWPTDKARAALAANPHIAPFAGSWEPRQ